MRGIVRSFLVSLWFVFLTFPLLVIKVVPNTGEVLWRWKNAVGIGIGVFFLSFVWRVLLVKRGLMTQEEADMGRLMQYLNAPANERRIIIVCLLLCGWAPLLYAIISGNWGLNRGIELPAQDGAFAPLLWPVFLARALAAFWQEILAALLSYAAIQHARGNSARILAVLRRPAQPGPARNIAAILLFLCLLPLPYMMKIYQINVLIQTFIWVMLGLGLNIVVGQAGLLVLGYVAFYAVGAYTYALGNALLGGSYIGFWFFLPLGGLFAALAGILLSLPVLRLRGDYLAIVTLGFGEIVRLILESGSLSLLPFVSLLPDHVIATLPAWIKTPLNFGGPAGIGGIPPPGLLGMRMELDDNLRYVYYIALAMTVFTVVAVSRLRDSRLGRSWMALREDEIACEAMGVDKIKAKLTAFALGACWAGFGGALFAAQTSYINPTSFTFMQSALILSVVVLGGLGSILGVALGACILILLPEYLRAFNEYRMLIFGLSMVLMMVFRPQGLIMPERKRRTIAGMRAAPPTSAGGSET
jgi:branched-chain amino acid transport system permease protein